MDVTGKKLITDDFFFLDLILKCPYFLLMKNNVVLLNAQI